MFNLGRFLSVLYQYKIALRFLNVDQYYLLVGLRFLHTGTGIVLRLLQTDWRVRFSRVVVNISWTLNRKWRSHKKKWSHAKTTTTTKNGCHTFKKQDRLAPAVLRPCSGRLILISGDMTGPTLFHIQCLRLRLLIVALATIDFLFICQSLRHFEMKDYINTVRLLALHKFNGSIS